MSGGEETNGDDMRGGEKRGLTKGRVKETVKGSKGDSEGE